MTIALSAREADLADLAELDWAGESHHLGHLARAVAEIGRTRQVLALVGRADVPVAIGVVTAGADGSTWTLSDLSVHPAWQGLGMGTALIGRLETAAADLGARTVRVSAEHDNPRALALYRRLGYRAVGSVLQSWPLGPRRRFVTVVTVLDRRVPTAA